MKTCGTYDDANLILRLYELRREDKIREARAWFVKSFYAKTAEEALKLCPLGSDSNAYYRMVTSYWDMVASLITGGVLQQDLFFESGRELLLVWERVRPVVPGFRELHQDPKYLSNLETVGGAYAAWMQQRGPGAYESFVQRVTTPHR